ncbi:MAG TPA: hypothetical protein VGM26_14760 [Rhizomicrobium sp.]|jgi:hypothetical protein
MRKYRPEIVVVRRRRGRKHSRVKVGLRVLIFFLAVLLFTGVVGITLNLQLEDAWQRRIAELRRM